MASPFNVFRSNLKPLMVGLTLLALFSFVLLPAIQMYQESAIPGGSDEVVATYAGGSFDSEQIGYYQRLHGQTNRFLAQVSELVVDRGGTPRVPNYGPDSQGRTSYGISSFNSPQTVVYTRMYADRASEMGLELDDTAIQVWLDQYVDGKLSANDLAAVRSQTSGGTLGQAQLFMVLRTELTANLYERMLAGGLMTGRSLLVSPVVAWENFLKLNQQAKAVAFPILVDEFLNKTGEPNDATVLALFEEGKDRFPNPNSPEPAFRRPYAAKIEYVAAHLEDFVAREIEKLDEATLRAEYERRLAGGDFVLPPLDLTPDMEALLNSQLGGDQPEEDQPEEVSGSGDVQPEASGEQSPVSEVPVDAPAEVPVDEPAGDGGSPVDGATELPATELPQEDSPLSRNSIDTAGFRLVATRLQDDQPPADQPPATEPPATEPPATEPPATEPPATEPPADEPASEQAEQPPVDEPAASAPPVTQPKTFEEVRDEIARDLAQPKAVEAYQNAISKANTVMKNYLTDLTIKAGDDNAEAPTPPQLESLAASLGLRYEQTPMQTILDVYQAPLGQARTGAQGGGQQLGEAMFSPQRPVYYPFRAEHRGQGGEQVTFSAWKTEARDAYVPTLADAREEVVAAAKLAEASKLARQAAEDLAKKANNSPDTPLKELVEPTRQTLVFEDLGPFSWMISIGYGYRPFLAPVTELDRVGQEFMQTVFSGPIGEFKVAPNEPKSVYYVVKATEITPPAEELRARYMQPNQRAAAGSLAVDDLTAIRQGESKNFEDQTGLEFNEEALAR